MIATVAILDEYRPGYLKLFTDNLCKETGWNNTYAEAVVTNALRFLKICAEHPNEYLVSSVDVDEAIDLIVSDTAFYRWIGQKLGRFVEHIPSYAHESNLIEQTMAYTTTIEYMRSKYGTIDTNVWKELPAACGGTGCHMKVMAGCWQSCRMLASA